MAVSVNDHPEIIPYLDHSVAYETSARIVETGVRRLLVVRQVSEFEGDEVVFVERYGKFVPLDTAPTDDRRLWRREEPSLQAERAERARMVCQASPTADHEKMVAHFLTQVNVFDSSSGPDGGNLACVWTVRHLAKNALERWITTTDSTSDFDAELRKCFLPADRHEDVPAGGIVISPTVWQPERRTGHVGFLGKVVTGGSRLIYSNSSSAAKFKQNFTVDSWLARYRDQKRLPVHFFRLPSYSPSGAIS